MMGLGITKPGRAKLPYQESPIAERDGDAGRGDRETTTQAGAPGSALDCRASLAMTFRA
jgi:hypothetical protein